MSVSQFVIQAFKFDSGDVLDISLSYKSINPSATKTALVTNCFTGRLAETVTLSGSGSALADYHVALVMQMGMGESSSPTNTPNFPTSVTYQDQIRAQHALVTQVLGFDHLDVALGYSMGGQAVYHWAAMYPDFVKNGVVICAAAATSDQTYLLVEGFIGAMTFANDWDAYVTSGTKPLNALRAFGRAYLPWLYSTAWYKQETYKKLGMESLKQFVSVGEDMTAIHDPKNLIVQGRQWQNANVGQVGDGLEQTLGSIKARMLLLPGKTDTQFTTEEVEADLRFLKNGKMETIPSVWGHAAGYGVNPEDVAWIDERVKAFLAG